MNRVKEFSEWVLDRLDDYLPRELGQITGQIVDVGKNNGTVKTGIVLQIPDCSVSPVIYLDGLLKKIDEGMEKEKALSGLSEIIEEAVEAGKEFKDRKFQMDLENYDVAKKMLAVRLINTEDNREMLKNIPHSNIEDLSVIPILNVNASYDMGVDGQIRIENKTLELWGKTEEEVLKDAIQNAEKTAPYVIKGLPAYTGEPPVFYILTNTEMIYGASVISYPGVLDEVAKKIGEAYYLLPSSVHEMLIIEKSRGIPPEALGGMVREVNSTEVRPEEVLSDRIYEYDPERKRLRQIPESMEKVKKDMER